MSNNQRIEFPRFNNLEWLRLIFAVQVVLVHSSEHLGSSIPQVIKHFPGVPAFFFVSGFLIYASYLNSPGSQYFRNRFLRLYPALIFVTVGSVSILLIAHGWRDLLLSGGTYAAWIFAQLTIGQAYNPSQFRDVGVGVMNGSLWTLTTEILFYFCVPGIVYLERKNRHSVLLLTALSFLFYVIGPTLFSTPIYREKTLYDIISLTPISWGWMFGLGILSVKHFNLLQKWLRYSPIALVPMYLMIQLGDGALFGSTGNRLGLFYFLAYISLILWSAFYLRHFRLNFDLSYGSYIWHMPVINLLLVLSIPSAPLAFIAVFGIATFSWFFIEKPALKMKRKSIKPLDENTVQ